MAKININELEPNSTIMLEGDVTFARLISKIEGEELAKRNEKARSRGIPEQEKPYTTLSLCNVAILPKNEDGTLNKAEQYIKQLLFKSNNEDKPGWNFSINDRSIQLPSIAKLDEDGKFVQYYPTRDFAAGQHVYVLIRIYSTRLSNGKSISAVMATDVEPKYYNPQGNRLVNELADYGLTIQPAAAPSEQEAHEEGSDEQIRAASQTRVFEAYDYDAAPYVEEVVEDDDVIASRPGIRFGR